jgi:hypothetical protein
VVLQLTVEAPNGQLVASQISTAQITPRMLQTYVSEVANVHQSMLLEYLGGHIRTGQTIGSIRARIVESSADRCTVAVGSQQRGFQLRILDKGRREVRPVNRKFLRWIAHPSGVVVYSKYSRAVHGSNIMNRAAASAMSRAPEIAQRVVSSFKDAALVTS